MAFGGKYKLYSISWEYLLTLLLLVFSGNPITRLGNQYVPITFAFVTFIGFYKSFKKDFYTLLLGVLSFLLALFLAQRIVLEFISWPGAINYMMTFFFGGVLIYRIGNRFPLIFFDIVSYISIISLIGYLVINLIGLHPPAFRWGYEQYSYGIYTYVKLHQWRNCGMFWEPGAFAGIIVLATALNMNELSRIWEKYKLRCIAILIALLTTQSTTGYFVFFIIILYYFLVFIKSYAVKYILIILMTLVGFIVYEGTDFLKAKVEHQSETGIELSKEGQFSSGRFSSFLFDLHYIKKHPIVGNGLHETTRYADNPELLELIKYGVTLGHGNGLSNYTASMGIPFMIIYLMLVYFAIYNFNRKIALLVTLVIILSLFSEQWLRYPLYTGIFFLRKKVLSFNG